MKQGLRRTLTGALFAVAAIAAGSAGAEPTITCSVNGQQAIVPRGFGGAYEVWQCFDGDWFLMEICPGNGGVCMLV
ncbi:hypothetical protein [Luteimonas sp. gir]|uniref:hypothetical protein n=1 Tax=Luteimonas sp. gir TaxID=3127960 RepID=UPI003075BA47